MLLVSYVSFYIQTENTCYFLHSITQTMDMVHTVSYLLLKHNDRISLVVQWLIAYQFRGHGFNPRSGKIPQCQGK